MDVDPAKQLEYRLHQRAYLSHYASEPMASWDGRPVGELEDAYAEVSRIIARENGKS